MVDCLALLDSFDKYRNREFNPLMHNVPEWSDTL